MENERHRKQRAVKEKRVITDPKNRNESAISKEEDFRIIECVSILCLSVSLSLRHVLNDSCATCSLLSCFQLVPSCLHFFLPSSIHLLPPSSYLLPLSLHTCTPTTRIKLIPARTHASRALCDAAVRSTEGKLELGRTEAETRCLLNEDDLPEITIGKAWQLWIRSIRE